MNSKFNFSELINREYIVQEADVIVTTIYPLVYAGSVKLAKRFPVSYNPVICLIIGGKATYAYDKINAFQVGKFLTIKESQKKGFTLDIFNKWQNDFNNFSKFCDQLYQLNFEKLSNQKIETTYQKFNKLYTDEYSLALLTDGFGFYMDEHFSMEMLYIVKNKTLANKLTNDLTIPTRPSFMQEEKTWLKDKTYKEYHQKYYWMESSYSNKKEIDESLYKQKTQEIKSEKINPNDVKIKKNKIIKDYGLEKLESLINQIELASYWQDQRKMANMMANYWLHRFNDEFSKRLDISIDKIRCLSPDEIIAQAKKTKKINDFRRQEKYGIIGTKDGVSQVPFHNINDLKTILFPKDISIAYEIKGMIASRGKTKGRVRIILTVQDLDKMKQGEILVSSMTRPELLPAVKKAAAIITNEGGITCHAAIISREFSIPCIIGTKIATKKLKDGNLVEVDANNGVIKVLEK